MNHTATPPRTATALTTALAYASRGWHIVPCHNISGGTCSCGKAECKSPGKHPRTKNGLKDATTDPATIRQWWKRWPQANIAIRTGAISGIVAVDIDLPDGPDTIHELQNDHGELPVSPINVTGSGGRQLIFAHPGGEIKNRTRWTTGCDFRGDNGYIVAPPSNHDSGNLYQWLDGFGPDDCELPAMPEWLLQMIRQPDVNRAETNGHASGDDLGAVLKVAAAYVAKLDGAGEGRRNQAAFSAAGHLFAFTTDGGLRLSEGEVVDLLRGWNLRNKPCLDESELWQCVRSAATNGTPRADKVVKAKGRPAADKQPHQSDEVGSLPDPRSASGRTDTTNARRLIVLHGDDLRFCDPWGKWLIYDGARWRLDDRRDIDAKAKDVGKHIWQAATELAADGDKGAGDVINFAKASSSAYGIRNMIDLARSEPGIPTLPEVWDTDPLLFNVANGTIDLRNGEFRPHRRGDYLTKVAGCKFDAKATCPTWQRFINEVFDGSKTLVEFIRRAMGYTLTGQTVERCLFFCYGTGRNGKTTLVSLIQKMLGDYATTLNTEALMVSFGQQHPTERADLAGARMAVASETEDGRRFAESLLKTLTGGEDVLKARRMREDFWEFRAQFKLWIAGNHKPRIRGTDPAIWDRIRLIPFNVRFDKPDKRLPVKLEAELPGILNWALAGCLDWQQGGLGEPAEVTAATEEYRAEMDLIGQFIADCCIVDIEQSVGATAIYKAYKAWCDDNSEKPANQKRFGTALTERGFDSLPTRAGKVRDGIGLATEV